jgi:uncharacterized protein YhaN
MQLRRLMLKNFRRFDRIEINFERGLNLVKGPNEAGKSTLQDAIITGLLDRPTGKQKERQHQKWGEERLYQIDLTYLSPEGETLTIAKDFETGTYEVLASGESATSKAALEDAVLEAIGTLSQDLFVSTTCIRQDAMTEIGIGSDEISTQLQGILLGGDGRVDRVIDQLTKRVAEFERGWKTIATRNPGPIRQLQINMEEIDREISRIEPEIASKESASEDLQVQEERLESIQKELVLQNDLHETHKKKRELGDLLDAQREREGELERRIEKVRDVSGQITEFQDQLDSLSNLTTVDEEQKLALQEANQNRKTRSIELKDRELQLNELLVRAGSEETTGGRFSWAPNWIPAALLFSGLGLGFWGLLMLLMPEKMMFAELWFLFSGVGIALIVGSGYWLTWKRRTFRGSRRVVQDQVVEAQKRYQEGVRAADDAHEKVQILVNRLGYDNWGDYQFGLNKVAEIENKLMASESALNALINNEGALEGLEAERKTVSRDRRDAEEQLGELEEYGDLSPVEFQRLISAINELESQEYESREKIIRFETILEGTGPTIGDLHRYEELRAAALQRVEHAMDRHEVLVFTLEGLREAREATMSTARDELEPRLSGYLGMVTGGRYDRATVDGELKLHIPHPSKEGSPIEMDELSQGTQDQVYLSARLALCDLVFGEARPPLLMDDPFVKFDPERREAALKLCKDLAADRQIILFTCHDGYDAYADHVIELE